MMVALKTKSGMNLVNRRIRRTDLSADDPLTDCNASDRLRFDNLSASASASASMKMKR